MSIGDRLGIGSNGTLVRYGGRPMLTESRLDRADLRRLIASNHDWYHTIELAPGVITPGWVDTRPVVGKVPLPPSLAGKRCLDVGTWDGFWALELERRGAAEVHAVDVPDPYQWDWPARARIRESYDGGKENLEKIKRNGNGFPIVQEAVGSSAERHELTVYEISPERLGTFDFVFVGSLLLHLRDPIGALEQIRTVATGEVVVNDCIEYVLTKLYRRTPMARLDAEDRVWWWQVNLAALHSMIEQAGFQIMEAGSPYFVPFGPRYPQPRQGPRDVFRRLRTVKGWEELVLNRRGIAHAAVRCAPLTS
jgi:tRNA (mo5U34)-methyltransferase